MKNDTAHYQIFNLAKKLGDIFQGATNKITTTYEEIQNNHTYYEVLVTTAYGETYSYGICDDRLTAEYSVDWACEHLSRICPDMQFELDVVPVNLNNRTVKYYLDKRLAIYYLYFTVTLKNGDVIVTLDSCNYYRCITSDQIKNHDKILQQNDFMLHSADSFLFAARCVESCSIDEAIAKITKSMKEEIIGLANEHTAQPAKLNRN